MQFCRLWNIQVSFLFPPKIPEVRDNTRHHREFSFSAWDVTYCSEEPSAIQAQSGTKKYIGWQNIDCKSAQ